VRLGEVCGLKVPHVVLLERKAVVEFQDNRQREGESSKLKSRRQGDSKRIHVPRAVGERLLSYAEPGSLYLFNWKGKPIPSDRVTRHFPAVCKKAGVPRMRFHDLRHLCRSALESAGASQTAIMQILGHNSARNSMRYQTEAEAAQMEAIDRVLGVTLRNG
jgi:integrase